jgi:hypothetical protein
LEAVYRHDRRLAGVDSDLVKDRHQLRPNVSKLSADSQMS